MKTISLEYCHVTPDTNWEEEIRYTNEHTTTILRGFSDTEIQKCIMVDDLHVKAAVDKRFLDSIVHKLEVKPDCVYLESSFVLAANNLLSTINPEVTEMTQDEEKLWLRKIKDQYGSVTDFLVNWKTRGGVVKFSCPTLVATSYLYRLGFIKNQQIKSIWGENILIADQLLNVLSSKFLQVETNAQTIIKATFPEAIERIRWYFY